MNKLLKQLARISSRLVPLFLFTMLAVMLLPNMLLAQESDNDYHERMKWWDEGRLGMFMHWGVYSTFGGEYKGEDYGKEMVGPSAEWIYFSTKYPQEDYKNAALNWNPEKFNAEEWVLMAKNAGMKYMVLTSKHHDGYALFDSKASDWNVVKTSAINRDLVKEYVDACHKHNMRVGFYYSHEKDWTHHKLHQEKLDGIPEKYVELVKQQITELFTQYGKIDVIWFDMPNKEHEEFNKMCAGLVRKYQPECIINGRIGSGLGDYQNVKDRVIVDPGMAGYKESIMTMRLNWGFDKNDDLWKSSNELIGMLSQSACRGSNFLLNIGPKPDGTFPLEDQIRLRDLSEWMKVNGEAIYKTNGGPFLKDDRWGSLTQSKEADFIYLHLYSWTGGDITVKGLKSRVEEASFLDTGEKLTFKQDKKKPVFTIDLPEINSAKRLRIVKLKVDGKIFDTTKGPNFEAPKTHHLNHKSITGTITEINGVDFTISDDKLSLKKGNEINQTKSFTLNEKVRFRTNKNGDIRAVQSPEFNEGQKYRVVYIPYKEGDEVVIVTKID